MSASLTPAVFLDKDGTLLENVPYNADPLLMRWTPGASAALRLLAAKSWPLVVVTNQPGIALGYFTESQFDSVKIQLGQMFHACGAVLAGVYYCPHHPRAAHPCACRKPQPGLLLQAAARLNIDLARSWMVGDILDDIEAGRRAGCRSILVDNGNESEWRQGAWRIPHHIVPGLEQAARLIAGQPGTAFPDASVPPANPSDVAPRSLRAGIWR